MRMLRLASLLALGSLLLLKTDRAAAADDFPLKDGDIWVMAGDSITAQKQHSNYFEAFCFARYPNMKFAFRNSGVGGHTIPTTLARFDYDIAAWNPTVVSVELGMNDKGGTVTEKFVQNMGTMVGRIREIKARPVILSASPVNNGETMQNLGQNKRLSEYGVALKEFSAKEKIPYANQFHALVDVWGKNFAAKGVSMQGDAVHPGPPGQLMMANALLKALGAKEFVSSVTITGEGKVDAKGCAISDVKVTDGLIAFDRLDECVPSPIPDAARAVVDFDPTILEMSQYMLKATGLKPASYTLKINGVVTATLTAKQLEAGVNLTAFGPIDKAKDVNPIVAQGRAILKAVADKEAIVGQWRALSKKAIAKDAPAELKTELAALTKKVEEADVKIREAAKVQKLHFELSPAQ